MARIKTANFPDEVQDLGDPEALYKPTGKMVFGVYTAWVMAVVMLIASGVIGYVVIFHPPREANQLEAALGCLGAAIFFFLLMVFAGWFYGRKIKQRVLLYPDALVCLRANGHDIFPWDDIKEVWQKITHVVTNGMHTGTRYLYTIRRKDDKQIKLTEFFAGIEEVGDRVQQEMIQRKLPKALKKYQEGKGVHFGDLSVDRTGIHYGTKMLTWDEVEKVEVADGMIKVRKAGKWLNWCKIAASDVPNLFVCLALIHKVVGVTGKSTF